MIARIFLSVGSVDVQAAPAVACYKLAVCDALRE
jgi:hypothetical protein